MRGNNPIVSTAKVRGLIKKNGINYVDATRRLYPTIAYGVSVWQLCDDVYFEAFGSFSKEREDAVLAKFAEALATIGLTYETTNGRALRIVKAVA